MKLCEFYKTGKNIYEIKKILFYHKKETFCKINKQIAKKSDKLDLYLR